MKAVGVDGWEEIEMTADSGAGETVVGIEDLKSVEMAEGESKRKGVRYEVADGTLIANKGEEIQGNDRGRVGAGDSGTSV